MRKEWNLKKFFYSSLNDPRLAQDVASAKRAYDAFAKKYGKSGAYIRDAKKLLTALRDWEKLLKAVGPAKPLLYANYVKELDQSNTKAQAKLNALVRG